MSRPITWETFLYLFIISLTHTGMYRYIMWKNTKSVTRENLGFVILGHEATFYLYVILDRNPQLKFRTWANWSINGRIKLIDPLRWYYLYIRN